MTPLLLADLMLRGASLGVLVLVSLRLISLRPFRFLHLAFLLLMLSVLDYVLVSAPVPLLGQGVLATFLLYVPLLVPFFLWWAGQALFIDEFKARPWHLLPAALTTLPIFLLEYLPQAVVLRVIFSFVLYGHVIYVGLSTAAADLLEERRKFRLWFIVTAVVIAAVTQGAETSLAGHALPGFAYPLQPLAILALVTSFAYWALQMQGAIWRAPVKTAVHTPAPKDPVEAHLLTKLTAAMEGGIWRQEGLTIGSLAIELDIPAHQLRRLINSALGYRNFSSFVNERRITAACEALRDPAQAGTSVLSLGFAVGFASIGPFNRAFRLEIGESPSAYRQRHLTQAAQN